VLGRTSRGSLAARKYRATRYPLVLVLRANGDAVLGLPLSFAHAVRDRRGHQRAGAYHSDACAHPIHPTQLVEKHPSSSEKAGRTSTAGGNEQETGAARWSTSRSDRPRMQGALQKV